jgi:hypothetical protein
MTQEEIKLQPHKIVNGVAILLTDKEIAELNYISAEEQLNIFNNIKTSKLSQLKANKEASLNGFVLISLNGFDFNVYKSQLEALAARIFYLETNSLSSSNWTDNYNFRRELTLAQFKDLYARARTHYAVLDDNTYTLYTDLKNEINAISIDGKYFNENQEPISALQALENINIDF